MLIEELLGLTPTSDPSRWQMTLVDTVVTPSGALHGGSGLAAAVEAMTRNTGRPLVWAAAQYLTHATPPAVLDVAVTVEVEGRYLTQARCVVTLDGHEVLTVHGALGERPFPIERVWERRPEVPPPAECRPRFTRPGIDDLLGCWTMRIAAGRTYDELDGTPGPGRSATWYRMPGGRRMVTAGDLGIIGDFSMVEFSEAVGARVTGNSLDNTIRVASLVPTEWVLLDARVHSVSNGFGTVSAHLWADDGTLLGIASQTLVLRTTGPDGRSTRQGRRIAGIGNHAG